MPSSQTHTGAFESSGGPPALDCFSNLPGGLGSQDGKPLPRSGQGAMAELGFRVHSQSPSVSSAGGRQLPPGRPGRSDLACSVSSLTHVLGKRAAPEQSQVMVGDSHQPGRLPVHAPPSHP